MVFCFLSFIFQSFHCCVPSSLFQFRPDCLPCIVSSPRPWCSFVWPLPSSPPPHTKETFIQISASASVFCLHPEIALLNVNNLLGAGKFEDSDMILSWIKCVKPVGSEPFLVFPVERFYKRGTSKLQGSNRVKVKLLHTRENNNYPNTDWLHPLSCTKGVPVFATSNQESPVVVNKFTSNCAIQQFIVYKNPITGLTSVGTH